MSENKHEQFEMYSKVEVSNNGIDWFPALFLIFVDNEEIETDFRYIAARTDITIITPTDYRYCRHPQPEIAIDTPVWVWHHALLEWINRHFAGWCPDGRIKTWVDGRTKHSAENVMCTTIETWRKYSLTNPNE